MLLFDAPEKRKATKRKNPVDKTYPISFAFAPFHFFVSMVFLAMI